MVRTLRARLRSGPAGLVRWPFKAWYAGTSMCRLTVRSADAQVRCLYRIARGHVRPRQQTLEVTIWLYQYSQLPAKHRRRARARVRKAARRHPYAARLYASIASPVGMGNDGQKAYDLATRTWFGSMIGTFLAAGQPWFDARNPTYAGGAKGDGITNDTVAANAASSAAGVAGGGLVFFDGGNYKLSGNGMYILVNGVGAMGVGRASRLFLDSSIGYNPGFLITIGNNVNTIVSDTWISDLYFDGNERSMSYSLGPVNAPIYGEGLLNYIAPVHVGINMCLVGGAFNGSQTQNLRILNCSFFDIAREAIWFGTNRNTLGLVDHIDSIVQTCIFNQVAYGSTIESSQRQLWVACTFHKIMETDPLHSSAGFLVLNYLDLRDIVISACTFDGELGNGMGISTADARQGGNVAVTDVTVTGCALRGFSPLTTLTSAAMATMLRATITGNTVLLNHARYGIYALDNCILQGNYVAFNDLMGIGLGGVNGTCHGNVIRANNRLNSGTALFRAGLVLGEALVPDTTAGWTISVNRIYDDQGGSQFQYAVGTGITPLNLTFVDNDLRGNVNIDAQNFASNVVAQISTTVRNNLGLNPEGVQNAGFAVNFTPSLSTGNTILNGTSTANQTINAPSAINRIPGQRWTFIVTMDGTGGWTIAWNAAWNTRWQPIPKPGAVSSISFIDTGTTFVQLSGQVPVDAAGSLDLTGHVLTDATGPLVSSALGVNITSVTPTGDDVVGILTIVVAGAVANNAGIATLTYNTARPRAPKRILLTNLTTAALAAANFSSRNYLTTAFDLANGSVALGAGTYIVGYVVLG